jgi:hypothetical protein
VRPADLEDPRDFARVPDGFERLWTPHRMAYIEGEKPTDEAGSGCPFCAAPAKSDPEGLIVARGELCYVVMNLFPYNPGHVLICPYRHVPRYLDLTDAETAEFTALTKTAGRRCRGRGALASARRATVGRRRELPTDHRPNQGVAAAARRRPQHTRRSLAGQLTIAPTACLRPIALRRH